jgi:hypothetical protein
MFGRGFGLVSRGRGISKTVASDHVTGPASKPFAGAGIAIFLLVSIAGEAVTTIHAFRHESPVVALVPGSPAVLSGLGTAPMAMPDKRNSHGTIHRAGQAAALVIHDRSKSQAGSKPKEQSSSVSNGFMPAK